MNVHTIGSVCNVLNSVLTTTHQYHVLIVHQLNNVLRPYQSSWTKKRTSVYIATVELHLNSHNNTVTCTCSILSWHVFSTSILKSTIPNSYHSKLEQNVHQASVLSRVYKGGIIPCAHKSQKYYYIQCPVTSVANNTKYMIHFHKRSITMKPYMRIQLLHAEVHVD